ncbi:MAG: diguanylate cyclase [Chloroflexota bacterium]|jgi:diguanylate cyclase (GGDEF)-like protein
MLNANNAVKTAVIPRESPVELVLGLVPEWDELLVSTLELSTTLMNARWCALFLLDPERRRLMLAKLWERNKGTVLGNRDVPPGELEWRAVDGNTPVAALAHRGNWLGEPSEVDREDIVSCACIPVDVEGARFGVVELIRGPESPPFDSPELDSLKSIARHLGLWFRNSAILQQLRELAITDGLTGVYNHRYFQNRLDLELERATRYTRALSLIMIDIDDFKRYNDQYGHQQGDLVLRHTALAIQRAVRRIDVVARYGGDEFAVILPETEARQALLVAKRIHNAILSMEVPLPGGGTEQISSSLGVSYYPGQAADEDQLIARADGALYRAKSGSGKKIRLWAPDCNATL